MFVSNTFTWLKHVVMFYIYICCFIYIYIYIVHAISCILMLDGRLYSMYVIIRAHIPDKVNIGICIYLSISELVIYK